MTAPWRSTPPLPELGRPADEGQAAAYLIERGVPPTAVRAITRAIEAPRTEGGSPWGMSRHGTARMCERAYALRYGRASSWGSILQLRLDAAREDLAAQEVAARYRLRAAAEPEARFYGSVAHLLLAYFEAAKMPAFLRPRWFFEKRSQDALAEMVEDRVDLLERVYAQFPYYRASWQVGDQNRDTLAVELPIEVRVRNIMPVREEHRKLDQEVGGLRVSGALDRLVYDRQARALDIIDYKFKGRGWSAPGLSGWTPSVMAEFRPQALIYLWIARNMGIPVRRFLVRRVLRNTKSPTRLPGYMGDQGWMDADFQTDENAVEISPQAYAHIPDMIYEASLITARVDQKLKRGEIPAPNFSACMTRYGECDYAGLCHAPSVNTALVVLRSAFREEH